MKLRGISHPSYFARGVSCSLVVLLLLLCVLDIRTAFAQAVPVLRGVSPQQARLGEQLDLVLDGEGFSQLDNLTSVNISGVPVSYSHYEIIDDQTIMVSLQIPDQGPTGDQRITFIFDNEYRLVAPFAVLEPAGSTQEGSYLNRVSPSEGRPGEQLSLTLDGGGFSLLGALQAVNISGADASLLDYSLASDRAIEVLVGIPQDAPPGEGDITFFFENGDLNAPFVVLEPGTSPPEQQAKPSQETPLLYGVSPQQGHPGEQLPINLDGGGFTRLGKLQAVEISGAQVPLLDYTLASDQAIQVLVRIPQDASPGEGDITFHFENGDLNAYFVVVQPGAPPPEVAASPVIQGISPPEGRAGSDLSLRLSGENLSQLGNLQSVDINGIEIPDVNYQVLSDQTVEIQLTIPADVPAGSGQISFFFDNSTFEAPFNLLAAAPGPWPPIDVIILVLLFAGVIGFIGAVAFIGWRLIRRPRPLPKSTSQQPAPTPPQITFNTHLEPGSQSIETNNPSIKANFDIRLVTTIDYGVQYIELEQDSLTAE